MLYCTMKELFYSLRIYIYIYNIHFIVTIYKTERERAAGEYYNIYLSDEEKRKNKKRKTKQSNIYVYI